MLRGPGTFPSSWNIACARLRPAERAKTFVRRASNQGLETKPNRVGIGPGAGRRPGVPQEALVDMKGLLHTDNYAITIWSNMPYLKRPGVMSLRVKSSAPCVRSRGVTATRASGSTWILQEAARIVAMSSCTQMVGTP